MRIDSYLKRKWTKHSNQKTQTGWMDTKTRPVSKRDSLQIQGHIQTESERMEKGIPHKLKAKESQSSNIYIR